MPRFVRTKRAQDRSGIRKVRRDGSSATTLRPGTRARRTKGKPLGQGLRKIGGEENPIYFGGQKVDIQ